MEENTESALLTMMVGRAFLCCGCCGALDGCVIMYLNKIILCICEEGGYMVKNNIEVDVKVKCIESGKTQVQIAEEISVIDHLK